MQSILFQYKYIIFQTIHRRLALYSCPLLGLYIGVIHIALDILTYQGFQLHGNRSVCRHLFTSCTIAVTQISIVVFHLILPCSLLHTEYKFPLIFNVRYDYIDNALLIYELYGIQFLNIL